MTMVLTSMICYKLLGRKHKMARQSGAFRDNGVAYLSIVGILVESAVLYTAICWIWVGLSITNNPAIDWFDGILTAGSVRFKHLLVSVCRWLTCLQFLNQSWIILRISMGQAYHAETPNQTPDNLAVYGRSLNTPISAPPTNGRRAWQSGISFANSMPIRDSVHTGEKVEIISVSQLFACLSRDRHFDLLL
jgi:hypothetical protein